MRLSNLATCTALATAAAALSILSARPAEAGCGCDHPPPGYAAIVPAFGSPGKAVRVHAPADEAFLPGAPYLVKMGGGESLVVAQHDTHLKVTVPKTAKPGPTEVEIIGADESYKYARNEFTVLAPAPVLPEQNGLFAAARFEASISEDGTLLVPFNLTEVAEATQVMVVVEGRPLSFEHDDVVFFNADGVDLTLFTLMVDDPTERQWGSYYGWEVEQDKGLFGTVYQNRVVRALLSDTSDKLTYWRHEFHTYAKSHRAGGPHEVDDDGYHKGDGTLHIDHDHLVLAIGGKLRGSDPDRSTWKSLSPGSETVDVYVLMLQTPVPLEPEMMAGQLLGSLLWKQFSPMSREGLDAYRRGGDDDDDDEDDD